MKYNNEVVTEVAEGLNNIFVPLKSVFDVARKMVTDAGENQLASVLHGHFKVLETSFNNSVRPAFKNMRDDLRQSVENVEAFDKAMNGLADPETAALDGVDQKRHTQAFSNV